MKKDKHYQEDTSLFSFVTKHLPKANNLPELIGLEEAAEIIDGAGLVNARKTNTCVSTSEDAHAASGPDVQEQDGEDPDPESLFVPEKKAS